MEEEVQLLNYHIKFWPATSEGRQYIAMAFKRKDKSKKKHKKSKHQDDWQLDGGGFNNESTSLVKRIGPRKTQERDERLRRSRVKHDERKRKLQFNVKMSKKVKFSDVLDKDESIEKSQTISDTIPKIKRITTKNLLPAAERLMRFLNQSKTDDNGVITELNDTEHENWVDSNEIELDVETQDIDNEEYEEIDENNNHEDDSVNESDLEAKDDGQLEKSFNFFDFYYKADSFDPNSGSDKSMVLHGKYDDNNDLFVSKSLSSLINNNPLKSIKRYSDIPNLHKMWSSRSNDRVGNGLVKLLLPYYSTYCDALVEGRSIVNDDSILQSMMLHACVHSVKARSIVIKHNEKLKSKLTEAKINAALLSNPTKSLHMPTSLITTDNDRMRDQGFCRPRVLILCPFRSTAMKCFEMIYDILGPNTTIANHEKFIREFSYVDEDENDCIDMKQSSKAEKRKKTLESLPEDWKSIFHEKNIDDDFKIGIQLNPGQGKGKGKDKGAYLRLYSDFMISDIIIASPLGLRLVIEKDDNEDDVDPLKTKENHVKPLNTYDYLSSLEMVIIHQADILYMQNWDHLQFIYSHINHLPKSYNDGIDFSRVRNYFLDGNGKHHCQLLLSTSFIEPEIQSFFRLYSHSKTGVLRLKKYWGEGSIVQVVENIQQVFQRIDINPNLEGMLTKSSVVVKSDYELQSDQRFNYFVQHVLKPLLRQEQSSVLIVIPSYFDFVRVRNELMRQEVNAAYISEYSRESEISRGRSRFFHGQKQILLYSGRAHFFRRFRIRGAKQVIFYSLPEYPHFYSEIVNYLVENLHNEHSLGDSKVSCLTLFTKYEQMALERIVGKTRCFNMLSSLESVFMFK